MLRIIRNFLVRYQTAKLKKSLGSCGLNVILDRDIIVTRPRNLQIEDNVYIGANAWISAYTSVSIRSGVIIGPRLKLYTGNHNYESDKAIPYDDLTIVKKVIIEENVWIGGDVIILPGIVIGEGAVIGAGSVITKNVPICAIVGGNPAKIIKERNKELYFKLKSENKIYLSLKSQGLLNPYIEER
jgi:maltose O-acetyltransferase